MDMVSHIMEKIGAEYDDNSKEGDYRIKDKKLRKEKTIASLLSENQDELLAFCKKSGNTSHKKKYGEQYIAILVLGSVMMKHGAAINSKTMKAILNACEKDPWGKNELERRICLDDFRDILSTYDHKTPTEDWKDNGAAFGVGYDELVRGRFSSKVALMARYYLKKFYGEKEWFAGINLIFSSGGYALLIGVKFTEERTPQLAIDALQGLFEVPLYLIDAEAFKQQEFDASVITELAVIE